MDTHLAPAHADVASRDVRVGSNMFAQLGHERLAKLANFTIGLSLRVKIRTSLTSSHH